VTATLLRAVGGRWGGDRARGLCGRAGRRPGGGPWTAPRLQVTSWPVGRGLALDQPTAPACRPAAQTPGCMPILLPGIGAAVAGSARSP
jgi:hypothetical protein